MQTQWDVPTALASLHCLVWHVSIGVQRPRIAIANPPLPVSRNVAIIQPRVWPHDTCPAQRSASAHAGRRVPRVRASAGPEARRAGGAVTGVVLVECEVQGLL